ncbi:MAG: hypothetical protein IT302_11615 [Dehalococcoidia bacterium]|nr:hypothetical protein [Dehalococcoidia bacterium]
MNAHRTLVMAAAGTAALAIAAAALAQSASGWTITQFAYGGGGTSTQAPYTVQGVIGQPLAGNATGGTYTVQSGFFAGFLEKFKITAVMLAKDGS